MHHIQQIYLNGQFVTPHGTEVADLISPTTNEVIGQVRLGDEEDTRLAIASAQQALLTYSQTTKEQRIAYLEQMQQAVARREADLVEAMVLEYGGVRAIMQHMAAGAIGAFADAITTLKSFDFERTVGSSTVLLEPVGVAGIITPWNASTLFICSKLATALSAGCTAVIKPSELSAIQTQVLLEALHTAGLPAGVFNVVNGRGDVVGAEITRNPGIAKISFTGSTAVGKTIARGAVDTMKRVTLELGGKSPNILLPDVDLPAAIPGAVICAFMNNGQACMAGTRLLVPADRLDEVNALVKGMVEHLPVGDPSQETTAIGPLVNRRQYERVQEYIRLGQQEGAQLLVGGEGHPAGLEAGNFVRPTVFTNVTNDMRIAREEIFGPVLTILPYQTEEEAIAIANDSDYGLHAYVSSADPDRARRVAARLAAGRVAINGLKNDSLAPFGGYKQSGIGREYGQYGLESYLEPKTVMA